MSDKKIKWMRLCNRHRWIPVVIAAVFSPLYILLTTLADVPVLGYVVAGFLLLSSLLVGAGNGIRLRTHFGKIMTDHCDPYPLLEEVDAQLARVKGGADRTGLIIDRCACLSNCGDYATAQAELEALNIDYPVVIPGVRFTYYYNLTTCALRCDQLERAEVYYQKTAQQLGALKGKAHDQAAQGMPLLTARLLYARGAYDEAYQVLAPFSPINLAQQVARAYHLGRIAIAQGQHDHARIHLLFASQNGNRFYIAQHAAALLDTLS